MAHHVENVTITARPLSAEEQLTVGANVLAAIVGNQGREQEDRRRITSPPPLQVRFDAAPEDIVDQLANIRGTELGVEPEPLRLDNHFSKIAEVYRHTSGRLVILGERGSGKSVIAQRLLLQLIADRASASAPVPVLFAVWSWNPAESLASWLTATLLRDFNRLDTTFAKGTTLAEALIADGRILPILDGFDEITPVLRTKALRSLNDTAMPLILTSTTDGYAQAVRESATLNRAAVIVLKDLSLDDVSAYLPRTSTATSQKWGPFFERLQATPAGPASAPAGMALTKPLMVGLARSIYSNGTDDPVELLDPERFQTSQNVEAHLLDRFVAAVYEQPPPDHPRPQTRGRPSRWTGQDAERWLGYLAQGTGDAFAWWKIADSMPRSHRMFTLTVPGAILGTTTGWLTFGPRGAALGCAVVTILAAVLGWLRSPKPERVELRIRGRAKHALRQVGAGASGGLTVGLLGSILITHWGWLTLPIAGAIANAIGSGLTNWARKNDPQAEPKALLQEVGSGIGGGAAGGAVIGLIAHLAHAPTGSLGGALGLGLVVGLAFSVGAALQAPPRLTTAVTPNTLLRSNRSYTIMQTITIGAAYSAVSTVLVGPMKGLVLGLAIGIAFGVGAHAWGRWLVLGRLWLPLTGRLPWRVWNFVSDAHSRDVLRQAGATYEFRHGLVRKNLATHYASSQPSRFWSH